MSIVSKMLQCAVCYRWMAHVALIVVYIEFAWKYASFNSNYYFMKTTHLLKPESYARNLQKSYLGPYHGNSSIGSAILGESD